MAAVQPLSIKLSWSRLKLHSSKQQQQQQRQYWQGWQRHPQGGRNNDSRNRFNILPRS
jgi:hypothetical protein